MDEAVWRLDILDDNGGCTELYGARKAFRSFVHDWIVGREKDHPVISVSGFVDDHARSEVTVFFNSGAIKGCLVREWY